MVLPCEGTPGGFNFLDFVYPYYISLSGVNMAAVIRQGDREGGSAPSGGMRCVTHASPRATWLPVPDGSDSGAAGQRPGSGHEGRDWQARLWKQRSGPMSREAAGLCGRMEPQKQASDRMEWGGGGVNSAKCLLTFSLLRLGWKKV